VAKLASHAVANSACSTGPDPDTDPDPDPDPDSDPSVVVPAVIGGESLEDFKLHNKNIFQIVCQFQAQS
jgi:hypothetical protein